MVKIIKTLALVLGLAASSAITGGALTGCVTTNRTYYSAQYRNEQSFQGIKTEAEKDKFRYGMGIDVMDVEKDNLHPENENVPIIGQVSYDGRVKHHQVNIVPELSYSAYSLRGKLLGLEGGLEARLGLGTELQIKVDTYRYDFRTLNEDYTIDGPLSSINPDVNFFLSGGLNLDYGHLSAFLQSRFDGNKEFSFSGGVGIRW